MRLYRITSDQGVDLGIFKADSEKEAAEMCVKDAGYSLDDPEFQTHVDMLLGDECVRDVTVRPFNVELRHIRATTGWQDEGQLYNKFGDPEDAGLTDDTIVHVQWDGSVDVEGGGTIVHDWDVDGDWLDELKNIPNTWHDRLFDPDLDCF